MENTTLRAIDAIQEAQKIAFAPFVFQATVSLRKLGVLSLIFNKRKKGGIAIDAISNELSVSAYGIGVLLEIAESSGIVSKDDSGNYQLTTTGYFLNYHETVNVNINFTNDVCYKGLFHLNESIKTGKPEGLKELGSWNTVYEGLSQLTPEIQKSWFEFDHHYSDAIFNDALKLAFRNNPKTIFDIGANTGKFAISCCQHNQDVSVKIIDLPGQINIALGNIKKEGFDKRVSSYEIDWLKDNPQIPNGADTIWMCQFLDCFSEEEILKVLTTCVKSMDDNTELMIMETFTDRQKFDNAKFILEATSLYFTVLANGNSKMYSAEVFLKLIDKAGLKLEEDISVGEYHTLLVCKKK
ncbi:methyltransferase [Flavivirga eckloniae]|uniref:SAM-dependent methyltransferase n=1 Tax=Flavivirga eckloniae TaxID=1803846 RepID=A0A2K9PRA6_9FLAO|nr:class I SAM-dependent methyltransferase [Flavivirga eckloniae]AUP79591.1 SAM-dependent methyltransferase [Flavivirga eckloniae]